MKRYLLIFSVATLTATWSLGQYADMRDQLYFKKTSIRDGLSQASVNCYFEDKNGFIWAGTDDGLNRYDGAKFTVFRNSTNKNFGLSNSQIWDIDGDAEGNLWMATAGGLNYLDINTNEIRQYVDSSINIYYTDLIYDQEQQRIWLAANAGGLKYFDLKSNSLQTVHTPLLNELVVWCIQKNSRGELLLGSLNAGVFRINADSFELEPYLTQTTSPVRIPSNRIRDMALEDDKLIVGMEGGGICIYNERTGASQVLNTINSSIGSDQVFSMTVDKNHNLFIGTDGGGLTIMNLQNGRTSTYKHIETDVRSIGSNVIRTIFVDSNENKWLGTYNSGINFVNRFSQNIYHLTRKYGQTPSLTGKIVNAFAEDSDGGLWIGLDKDGLDYFKDGKIINFGKGTGKHDLNDDVTMSLISHIDGALYIGTFRGGLNVYHDGIVEKFTHNPDDTTSISADLIWDMVAGPDGNIWLGTSSGLSVFDIKTRRFINYYPAPGVADIYSRNSVRSLFLRDDGNLWVGTFSGFGLFNLTTRKFEFFIGKGDHKGLSNEIIIKIIQDHKDRVWLCTFGGGLNLFNEQEKSFRVFDESDGLPGNLVQSIEEDDRGILWVSTIKGLARFDPEAGSVQILNESSGLQGDIFVRHSSFKTKAGYLLFGGVNGFNFFHPDSIHFPQLVNDIQITGFQIHNLPQELENQRKIELMEMVKTGQIDIDFQESRFFTVNFTLADFFQPEMIRFFYMLEGFDNQWNEVGVERKVTFTNLNPGNYTLNIRASLNGGVSVKDKKIRISIVPPFYRTRSAIFFMALSVVLAIIMVVKYRTASYKRRQQVLEAMVEEKNREINNQYDELRIQHNRLAVAQEQLKQVNSTLEEKVRKRTKKLKQTIDKLNKSVTELDRFVYSASHDLSAPLKSIKGLVNIARIDDKSGSLQVHINYIEQSILKLENVIQDLIQFSRNSRTGVNYEEINLAAQIDEVIHAFKYTKEYAGIIFEVNVPDDVRVFTDRQRMHMILHNIIGNAIKYSDESKSKKMVKVQYELLAQEWRLMISDNGIGIHANHIDKVFDMFYRATERSDGTGLGLFIVKEAVEKLQGHVKLESEEGKGTIFSMTLPIEVEG